MSGTRRKPGVFGSHVELYRCWLVRQGFSPLTAVCRLKILGQVGRWLGVQGLGIGDLSESRLGMFADDRRAAGYRQVPGVRSRCSLLEYLRDAGVVVPLLSLPVGEVDVVVDRYRVWLVDERGLAHPTVVRYVNLARRFLVEVASGPEGLRIGELLGADVTSFLLKEWGRVSVDSAKGRVAELRSLLRFFYLSGLSPLMLAGSVPPVAGWHDTGLPRSLSMVEVQMLLDGCDRAGRDKRDFAMLMLLARLGLRSIEVARLELGDINWRLGEIQVRGKARRVDTLPLPVDVGEAIAVYLRDARPVGIGRNVFLTERGPWAPIRPDLVSDVVRRACRRAGLVPVGAHRLRHALATQLLAKGAALVEISQVLRHADLATTAIYAKVDIASLREVAQPWPGTPR